MLVDTCVGRLFVEVVGEGEDVLLWHSLLCDGGMWRPQIRLLSDRYRFINVDAPGHGRSEPVRRAYSLWDCADAMRDVLDAVGVQRAAIAGLSWGGMAAMRFAVRYPKRVRALALCDTNARRDPPWKLAAYGVLAGVARAIGPIEPLVGALVPIYFSPVTLRTKPEVVADFLERITRMDRQALVAAVDAVLFRRDDIVEQLPHIRVPTLVLVGEDDRATPIEEAERIARGIAGARLVRVRDAGHLTSLEQPSLVADELEAFFDEHLGR
jgi:3-oxoadipate enol-lactonase